MLSAIAARKAAQAAHRETASSEPDRVATVPSPAPSLTPPPTRPSSKRKQALIEPRKKKKAKRVEPKKTRYFEQDVFQDQQEIIVVDSDSEDASEDIDSPVPVNIGSSPSKRRWSPSRLLNDSSDEEGDVEREVSGSPPPRPAADTPLILSTFKPIPEQNLFVLTKDEACVLLPALTGPATLLLLSSSETITLLGTYAFAVLRGSVSVLGGTLPASRKMHRVFAPRSSPLPILEGVPGEGSVLDPTSLSGRLCSLIQAAGALVLFQEVRAGVEGLGRVCRTFDGVFEPSRWSKTDASGPLQLSGVHVLTHQSKDVQPFVLPPSWSRALSLISAEPAGGVYLVKGPKKSGKSTFVRTLLNRLLTLYQKVAVLECDLGQSEFTPGGMVALNVIESPVFGPPFTHPTLPNFAHYIGSTTPRSSPSHYLAAIQSLIQSYRLDVLSPASVDDDPADARISDVIPIVVNTMGWTKGLGADLTHKIEDIVQPTDIYEIEALSLDSGWQALPPPTRYPPSYNAKLHALDAAPSSVLSTNYSPTDHRSLSILSYLHAVFPNAAPGELDQVTATTWNTALPLCARAPYEVDWASTIDKIVLTGAGTEDVVPSEIERVLNGALVALVASEPGTLDLDVDMGTMSKALPYYPGSLAPSPSTSICHGLALIRAMSPTSTTMHVLTPLPASSLMQSRVIVKGDMELPIWGMLDFRAENDVAGVERGNVPYLQWGKGEGIGGERKRVRRNLMRKGHT